MSAMVSTIPCTVCGAEAPAGALFCPRCTNPISVVSLASLTDADRARCMRALFEVLSATVQPASGERDELFDAYLSALWLRPETALIQYAEAVGIERLRPGLPAGAWLDLGCGDGVHSALYSGWRFSPEFDCFQSLDLTSRDIFDHFDARDFDIEFTRRGREVDVGIDLKPTAIARSRKLGIFGHVERADATDIPLPSHSVSVVFSNMIRDLGETLPAALEEVHRVLDTGGVLIASAMTPAYREALFFEPAARAAESRGDRAEAEQLLRLDRGRSTFCRQQLPPQRWAEVLAEAGLELEQTLPIVGPGVIRFWDVGLRPFSIQLIKQAQQWKDLGILREMKAAALSVLHTTLGGLRATLAEGEPCMHLIVARKR